jgi:WD40 repeat protein
MVRQLVSTLHIGTAAAVTVSLLLTLAGRCSAQERATLHARGGGVYRMAFSPDGKLLAVPEGHRAVVLWDVATAKPRQILEPAHKPGKGHLGSVTQLAFTPDGKTLIAAHTGWGEGGSKFAYSVVKYWEVATGQERLSFILEGGGANIALSPDGRILVTVHGYPNKTAKVWDLSTRKRIASLQLLVSRDIRTAAVTQDGKLLALGGGPGEVRLFELPSGKPRGNFEMNSGGVKYLTFSPDGRVLAVGAFGLTPYSSSGEWSRFWDVAAGKKIDVGRWLTDIGRGPCFSPDSKVFAAAADDLYLWSLPGRARLARLKSRDKSMGSLIVFSPDGRLMATGSTNGTIHLWDVPPLQPKVGIRYRMTLKIPGQSGSWDRGVRGIAFTPDGKMAAFATGARDLKVWDVGMGKEIASLEGHRNGVTGVAFSPDGKTVATAAANEPVRLWDLASRKVHIRLEGCAEGSRFVTFAPDGKTVATADGDHAIRLWDPASGKLLAALRGEAQYLTALAFSPDGKTLACVARKGGVALWGLAARKVRATLQGPDYSVISLAWTPDSKMLATVDGKGRLNKGVVLWDAALGKERKRLEVDVRRGRGATLMAPLHAVTFAPDGQTLAVVGSGGWVQLWDIGAGRLVAELEGQTQILKSVTFSADGRVLACGGNDGTVRLWDLPAPKP